METEGKTKKRKPQQSRNGGSGVNLLDIAREAKVAPSVVSTFLSGKYYRKDRKQGVGISLVSRKRIKDTCIRLNYVPEDPYAFFQIYPRKADVGFLMNDQVTDGTLNPYHALIYEGISRRAMEGRVDLNSLIFRSAEDYLINPEMLPMALQRGVVRKVVISGGKPNYSLILALQRLEAVVVLVGSAPALDGVVSIVPDFAEAGRLAVKTLYEQGHRHIVAASNFYMGLNSYGGKRLWEGFISARRDLDLPTDENLLAVRGPSSEKDTVPLADMVLAMTPRPTAVFCFDDEAARILGRDLAAKGLSVPRDISILGCNDDRVNQSNHPGYSTIHLPCLEIGQRAFEEVNRIAVDGPPAAPEMISMVGHYVDRGTIAPPQPEE